MAIWGKRIYIHFASRRFKCEECQKPFTEEWAWLEKSRRETIAYEEHIYQSCQGSSQAKVAQEEQLHSETVKGIFQPWLWEAHASQLQPFLKFVKTLRNWWHEFLNYFNEGGTSAIVEELTNGIRSIIRRAFGFHSFQSFRFQVLVELGRLPLPLF